MFELNPAALCELHLGFGSCGFLCGAKEPEVKVRALGMVVW